MKTVSKVKIRMYRQGLGDCFLLTFFGEKESRFNMLIDCGVLSKGNEYKKKMEAVAQNIKDETNNKIDVVVATHEHWDHLSGFQQAQPIFDSMTIPEIWMAWTEDPNDTFAKELKESQANKLTAISHAYEKLKKRPTNNFNLKQKEGHTRYLNAFNSFFNFFGIDSTDALLNLNGTGEAFDTLRKRKKSLQVFLQPATDNVIELKELPGVRIYVLGPPKNKKALNKMNPSKKDSELYELDYNMSLGRSFNSAFQENQDLNRPFDRSDDVSLTEAEKTHYITYFDPGNEWREINDDWLYTAGNLAIALDSAVNNTSLALAFEFIDSGKVLLFPADAQIGNWLSWSNYTWTVKNNGVKETVTMDDLFSRTVFYKVGHHGSHNATMKEQGLEKMKNTELIAMIPVDKKMAEDRNWKMPFKPLLDALHSSTKDKVIVQDENFPTTIKATNKIKDGISDLFFDVMIHNKPKA